MRALLAEGVTGASGYPQPIYRNRLFESEQWRKLPCPEAELMCEECLWVSSEVLLSDEPAIDEVARAFEKVAEHRRDLLDS
jgi:dTDP-4-amino-4,6-dideoxygalactose transaminase